MTDALGRAALLPSLRDFHTPLATLAETDADDLDGSVAAVARRLAPVSKPLTLRVEIDGHSWLLAGGPSGWSAGDGPATVEIILDAGTWRDLTTGRLTALEAFGRGRMRFRGELGEARRLARVLSGPDQ